ncbi:MAG: P-loop NTPase [Chloroflexota bacterium]
MKEAAWPKFYGWENDLPPGTGDVVISLIQRTRPDGAVVVATPQEVALDDARKAVGMFGQFETPVLGLVENMGCFICSNCQAQHDLFGHGGAQALAGALNIPFLGEIPLDPQARAGGDRGEPAVLQPGSPVGAALQNVAARIWSQLQGHQCGA